MGSSSTKTSIEQHATGSSKAEMSLGDSALPKLSDTPVQTALKSASKVIESGSDLINAPVLWFKDMQKNWLVYMIVAATILLTVAFLYCAVRSYFNRKGKNPSIGNLVELASMFVNKNPVLQTQFPLSASKLSSAASPTIVDMGV
jgi:hypothetical protein